MTPSNPQTSQASRPCPHPIAHRMSALALSSSSLPALENMPLCPPTPSSVSPNPMPQLSMFPPLSRPLLAPSTPNSQFNFTTLPPTPISAIQLFKPVALTPQPLEGSLLHSHPSLIQTRTHTAPRLTAQMSDDPPISLTPFHHVTFHTPTS